MVRTRNSRISIAAAALFPADRVIPSIPDASVMGVARKYDREINGERHIAAGITLHSFVKRR